MSNMGQVKGHPLEDWDAAIRNYVWPDADESKYYEGMEERFDGSEGKYITTGIFMLLFERMHSLRGMSNVLTELHTDPGRMAYLADRIVEDILSNVADDLRVVCGQEPDGDFG